MAQPPAHRAGLLERVSRLPDQPGVYLFRNARGELLYVGKALSLKTRVRSYFHSPSLSPRIATLVTQIADVEVQQTPSEAEALLLESDLIKRHHPKYNVAFRDDKRYPLLKLTHEPFPRLLVVRRPDRSRGARYFGPYADAGLLRDALQFFKRVFPLRTCRTFPSSPCLEYHLGQCLAPCIGRIDEAAYQRIVDDVVAFLEGKRDGLLRDLARRMKQAARHRRFEEAARIRDQIHALTSVIVAKEKSAYAGPLEQLQLALRLPALPRRIEAFDISNIMGTFSVGSMVVFADGKPLKAHYRHFKIETVQGSDDYLMMREVIRRRYSGSLATKLPLPDLILVDGGRGQLNAALEEIGALALKIPALGLAKQFEHIIVPDQVDPIVLLPTSPVLHLVQHARDEAHRFAITHHRRLRGKGALRSALDAIRGIGPARRTALLKRFGTLSRVRQASPAAIAKAAKISVPHAEALLAQLQHE